MVPSSSINSEMFSMTSADFALSCSFAGLVLIEIGNPFCPTATRVLAPEILLNPSYPVTLPLFWQGLLRSQRISSFAGWFFLACELFWLNRIGSSSRLLFAAKSSVFCLQQSHHRILLASRSACIRMSRRR